MIVRLQGPVIRYSRVTSTMEIAAAMADAGAAEGTVVVADEQTKGRGRAGRSWVCGPGQGLLCSVILRPVVLPERLAALPLMVGVAVANAIDAFSPLGSRLKWPNDLFLGDRKVAGVLMAARTGGGTVSHVIVGIGVNVRGAEGPASEGVSIEAMAGTPIDREQVLSVLLRHLDAEYASFLDANGQPDLSPWRERAMHIGEEVVMQIGARTVAGRFRDIDVTGALLLEHGDGRVERIVAGDMVRGPVAAALRR